jgi:hypothetical protein
VRQLASIRRSVTYRFAARRGFLYRRTRSAYHEVRPSPFGRSTTYPPTKEV